MFRVPATHSLLAAMILAITFGAGNLASATTIDPGFDLFHTVTPGTSFDFGFPIGVVELEGNPIGPGNADTIIQRLQGTGPFNQGETRTIDIELVALSLQSVAPVPIGPQLLHVDVIAGSQLGLPAALGQMTFDHTNLVFGDYDYAIPIVFEVTITDLLNPTSVVSTLEPTSYSGSGVWNFTVETGVVFFPNNPSTSLNGLLHSLEAAQVQIPEPATLTLFGLGLAGLGFARRRKKLAA